MYTDLKPFSLMGVPNKISSEGKILPREDLHAMLKSHLHNREEIVRSVPEKSSGVSVSVSKIKRPLSAVVVDHGQEEEDGGRITPKAVDHKKDIPLKCPPPPRKPKSSPSTKRKSQQVLLDLSNEIQSFFPPNLLRDFMAGKIKRVKKDQTSGFD